MHSVSLKKTKDITVICHDVTTSRRRLGLCGKKEQNNASAESLPNLRRGSPATAVFAVVGVLRMAGVIKRWEKKKNRDKSPVRGGTAILLAKQFHPFLREIS